MFIDNGVRVHYLAHSQLSPAPLQRHKTYISYKLQNNYTFIVFCSPKLSESWICESLIEYYPIQFSHTTPLCIGRFGNGEHIVSSVHENNIKMKMCLCAVPCLLYPV